MWFCLKGGVSFAYWLFLAYEKSVQDFLENLPSSQTAMGLGLLSRFLTLGLGLKLHFKVRLKPELGLSFNFRVKLRLGLDLSIRVRIRFSD